MGVLIPRSACAQASAYSYRSLITLGANVPGVGALKTDGDFKMGTLNAAGALTFVASVDGGEAAFLMEPDGTVKPLFLPGGTSPSGGTFGRTLAATVGLGDAGNPIVGLNDAGNISICAPVDRGDGEAGEVLFFDQTANTWATVLRKGMLSPGGGTFAGAVGFCTLNDTNAIAFTAKVSESGAAPAGTGVFLASGGRISTIARPGTQVQSYSRTARPGGDGIAEFREARHAQISAEGALVTFEGALPGLVDSYGDY